jgi:hypothetical protein
MMNPELKLTHWQGVAELSVQDTFTPISILPPNEGAGSPLRVLWAEIGHGPFSSPFFDQDLTNRLANARWFVSLPDAILPYAFRSPGVPLRGAILHMSRCGSTLARNLLGATDRSLVMSEAGLINSAIAQFTNQSLQPVFSGFLRPDGDRLQRSYLKCTSWNVLAADRILASFPGLPLVFIQRHSLEVLVSLSRTPGWGEGFPGGMNSPELEHAENPIERIAIRLRDFLLAARRLEQEGRCRIVKYPEIISRFIDGDLPEYFGYDVDEATRSRMLRVAEFNSKNPQNRFRADSAEKQDVAGAAPEIQRVHDRYLRAFDR